MLEKECNIITDLAHMHMHNPSKRTKNKTFFQTECSIYPGCARQTQTKMPRITGHWSVILTRNLFSRYHMLHWINDLTISHHLKMDV